MKREDIRKKLEDNGIYCSTLSVKAGVVNFKKGFFYTHGQSSRKIADEIKVVFPKAEILEARDIWKDFRGGASVAAQSHFLVKFKIND